ncbi:cardiolipin synthase [Methanoculleus sp. FWC-SCC1]|uniref:Cardiolipin synthase n=1 Tax=Methanoculleus frigidifontis TaxID=2584085 RepID=A0ABT8MAA2_9EURY|nr:cardiolipin synthase [Methanoculleus sp. FWC-SCC1]MDN7024863.1 cardiolipin synthase [Methanoculleus sp. FWC-SCC1]
MVDPVLFILLINTVFAVVIVFSEREDPTAALAWLLILFLLPTAGFVLYIIFGRGYFRRREFSAKAKSDRTLKQRLRDWHTPKIDHTGPLLDEELAAFQGLIAMLIRSSNAFLSEGNRIEAFAGGKEMFESFFAAIAGARHHIHIEVYIIRNDDLGRRFVEALAAKAREGVEVRLLYDTVGSICLPRDFFDPLIAAGGKAAPFYSSFFLLLPLRINYRNHRKITVIDGAFGYIGGLNVGEEYLGRDPYFGYWRDTHLKIAGPAARLLQLRFSLDWKYATGEDLNLATEYFPEVAAPGNAAVQIVSSGPDTRGTEIKEAFLNLIGSARETIAIQTPYFIPDVSIIDALRIAALSGVDVQVMIPDKPDHPFVYWATYSYIGNLIDAGVRFFTYNTGFLHSKAIVVDGRAVSVGSTNWDVRSFRLNFETNAFIYGRETATELLRLFEEDVAHATEITPDHYAARPMWVKVKESVSRLLSPIL